MVWSALLTFLKTNISLHRCRVTFPIQLVLDLMEVSSMGLNTALCLFTVIYLFLIWSFPSVCPQIIWSSRFQSLKSRKLSSQWKVTSDPSTAYILNGGSFVNFVAEGTEKGLSWARYSDECTLSINVYCQKESKSRISKVHEILFHAPDWSYIASSTLFYIMCDIILNTWFSFAQWLVDFKTQFSFPTNQTKSLNKSTSRLRILAL